MTIAEESHVGSDMLVVYVVLSMRNHMLDRSTFRFNHALKTYMISIINACLRSFKDHLKL